MRHGDRIQVAWMVDASLGQRLDDHGFDRKHVLAAGDLGKDAAKTAVQFDLRRHNIAQHPLPVFDNCRCGFVTACFNGKDSHLLIDL